MKKVEQFIQVNTKTSSNKKGRECISVEYKPWLTQDYVRKVAKIAREEAIKEVCEWLEKEQKDSILTDTDIERLKKHLEGKL